MNETSVRLCFSKQHLSNEDYFTGHHPTPSKVISELDALLIRPD